MTKLSRRTVVTSAAALSLTGLVGARAVAQPQAKPPTPGKPGDFDFLTGEWKIANKWRNKTTDTWLDFPGEATVRGILKGVVSVEECASRRVTFPAWGCARSISRRRCGSIIGSTPSRA
jgi:hypothetical protein